MQAITTKFLGPTNHRGARVVAKCQAKRITVDWDYALGIDENHRAAAMTLVSRMRWFENAGRPGAYIGRWEGGGLPDGTGNVYVFVPNRSIREAHGKLLDLSKTEAGADLDERITEALDLLTDALGGPSCV